MQCWAVVSSGVPIAALVTQIIKYPQRQVLDVYLVGGTRMNEWVDKVWLALKAYGAEKNCEAVRGFGRKGWIRRIKEPIDYSVTWSIEL